MPSTCLTINLDHLVENWRVFDQKCQDLKSDVLLGAVIKANAYGMGAQKVARRLWQEGCRTFFVAHACEGVMIRKVIPSKEAQIIVFHGVRPGQERQFTAHSLTPILNSLEDIERWVAFANKSGYRAAVLQVETGMNRLGLSSAQFQELCSAPPLLDALDVRLIMSHLSCADTPQDLKNKQQKEAFDHLMNLRPPSLIDVPLSMANSAGLLNGTDYHYDLARIGIGLYGGNPYRALENPFKSVLTLETEIIQVKSIKAGESVSYGANWKAKRTSRIATAAIGYGDGFLRGPHGAHSGQEDCNQEHGRVAIAGQYAPIIGAVTMDLTMIDVTDIDETLVKEGTIIELIGPHISIDEVAKRTSTIGYEVLTNIGRQCEGERVTRKYIGD